MRLRHTRRRRDGLSLRPRRLSCFSRFGSRRSINFGIANSGLSNVLENREVDKQFTKEKIAMKGNRKHKNGSKSKHGAKKGATASERKLRAQRTNYRQAPDSRGMEARELPIQDQENVQGLFTHVELWYGDAQKK